MANPFIEYVKEWRKKNPNVSYKDALKKAAVDYKKDKSGTHSMPDGSLMTGKTHSKDSVKVESKKQPKSKDDKNTRARGLNMYKKLLSNIEKAISNNQVIDEKEYDNYRKLANELRGKSQTNQYAKKLKEIDRKLKSKKYSKLASKLSGESKQLEMKIIEKSKSKSDKAKVLNEVFESGVRKSDRQDKRRRQLAKLTDSKGNKKYDKNQIEEIIKLEDLGLSARELKETTSALGKYLPEDYQKEFMRINPAFSRVNAKAYIAINRLYKSNPFEVPIITDPETLKIAKKTNAFTTAPTAPPLPPAPAPKAPAIKAVKLTPKQKANYDEVIGIFGLTDATRDISGDDIYMSLYDNDGLTTKTQVSALERKVASLNKKYTSGDTSDRLDDIASVLVEYQNRLPAIKASKKTPVPTPAPAPAPTPPKPPPGGGGAKPPTPPAPPPTPPKPAPQKKQKKIEDLIKKLGQSKTQKEEQETLEDVNDFLKSVDKTTKTLEENIDKLPADSKAKIDEQIKLAAQIAQAQKDADKIAFTLKLKEKKANETRLKRLKELDNLIRKEQVREQSTDYIKKNKLSTKEKRFKKLKSLLEIKDDLFKTDDATENLKVYNYAKDLIATEFPDEDSGGKAPTAPVPVSTESEETKKLIKEIDDNIKRIEESKDSIIEELNKNREELNEAKKPHKADIDKAIEMFSSGKEPAYFKDALDAAKSKNPAIFKTIEQKLSDGEDIEDILYDIELDPEYTEFTEQAKYFMSQDLGYQPLEDKHREFEDRLKKADSDIENERQKLPSVGNLSGAGFVNLVQRGMGRNNDVKRITNVPSEDKVYAEISHAVYDSPNMRPKVILGYRLKDTPEYNATRQVIYTKNDNDIIIGYRGTDEGRDVLTDAKLALGNLKSTFRFKKDLDWTHNVMESMNPNKVVFTGHSLGGTIAIEMCDIFRKNTRAVVFNAGQGIKMGNRNHLNVRFYSVKGDFVSMLGTGAYKEVRILANDKTAKNKTPLGAHSTTNFDVGRPENFVDSEENSEEDSEEESGGSLYSKMKSGFTSVGEHINMKNFKKATEILGDMEKLNDMMPEKYQNSMLNEIKSIKKILV